MRQDHSKNWRKRARLLLACAHDTTAIPMVRVAGFDVCLVHGSQHD
jgi:hypothetical protein